MTMIPIVVDRINEQGAQRRLLALGLALVIFLSVVMSSEVRDWVFPQGGVVQKTDLAASMTTISLYSKLQTDKSHMDEDTTIALSPATTITEIVSTTTTAAATKASTTNDFYSSSLDQNDTLIQYYTIARTDRTGSQIFDLLKLDAYAFKHNGTSGGACIDMVDFNQSLPAMKVFDQRLEQKKSMLRVLGLQDMAFFACPTQDDLDAKRAVIIDHEVNRTEFGHNVLFTTEWHQSLQARSTFSRQYPSRTLDDENNATLQIAVHVRRGDYDPCHPNTGKKYLPNKYYLGALDEYLPRICTKDKTCNVTIYSEDPLSRRKKVPSEEFAPFRQLNYTTTLDFTSTPEEIWRAFVQADALFVSRSTFSLVPALLNHNQVIYPHGYHVL
jgi:hypothetical protein